MGLVGLKQFFQRTIMIMLAHYTEFMNGEVLRGGPWTETMYWNLSQCGVAGMERDKKDSMKNNKWIKDIYLLAVGSQ